MTSRKFKLKDRAKTLVWVMAIVVACGLGYVWLIGGSYAGALFHYVFMDFDMEKFRSAKFIIDNLDYHNVELARPALTESEREFKRRTDSIGGVLCSTYGWDGVPMDSVFAKRKEASQWFENHLELMPDKEGVVVRSREVVTSDMIVNQVDEMHNVWHHSPYARLLSYSEFRESLLPFGCIGGYGEVHNPHYYKELIPLLEGLKQQPSLRNKVAYYHKILQYLRDINSSMGQRSRGGELSLYSRDEDCLSIGHYACMILRANGIPTVVDHVVGFRQLAGRHFFNSLYDTSRHKWFGFNAEGSLPGDSDFLGTPVLNIYRDTYQAQKDTPYFLRTDGEFVPRVLANPCMKDVTELYMPTTTVTTTFKAHTTNRLAYLASFGSREEGGLLPATWGTIDKRHQRVVFNNVVPDVIYFPVYYDGEKPVCYAKPFYVTMRGGKKRIHHLPLTYGKSANSTIVIQRKYPIKRTMKQLADNMKGSVIVGSNDKSFGKADTLLRLSGAPTQYLVTYPLSRTGNYRYYRFVPPKEHPNANIAHMEWLTSRPSGGEKASPQSVTTPNQTSAKPAGRYWQLRDALLPDMESRPQYDHNPTTSAGGYPYIMLQLDRPQRVEAVSLMAMHAGNTIVVGHDYQLLYWDGEWRICAQTRARHEYLELSGIPSGKLYWLRDLTVGDEEMPFLMVGGRQVFLYDFIDRQT